LDTRDVLWSGLNSSEWTSDFDLEYQECLQGRFIDRVRK